MAIAPRSKRRSPTIRRLPQLAADEAQLELLLRDAAAAGDVLPRVR